MMPSTMNRVSENTAPEVNRWIRARTEVNLEMMAGASNAQISKRIKKLESEWDIERTLEANAAAAVIVTTMLGFTKSRLWFAASGMIGMLLFQHATQGWCPPVPLLRRLGVRTSREIESEITGLKVLRGDFEPTANPEHAMRQALH